MASRRFEDGKEKGKSVGKITGKDWFALKATAIHLYLLFILFWLNISHII